MAWTLCTKEEVVAFSGIPISELKDEQSSAVEALIMEYLGSKGLLTTTTITNEKHSGNGSSVILIDHPPLASVISVSKDGIAYDTSQYTFNAYGVVLLNEGTFDEGVLNILVSYTVSEAATWDIKLTAVMMILALHAYARRGGTDASLKWADVPPELGGITPASNIGIISHLKRIMREMLKRTKVRIK